MLDAAFLSVHQTLVWSFPNFFVKMSLTNFITFLI